MLLEKSLTKEAFAKQAYLLFFNRQLLEQGVIDEKEYVAMKNRILAEYAKAFHSNVR